MIISIGAALALHLMLQAGQAPRAAQRTVVRDSTAPDSTRHRAAMRLPVTADLLRTAFRDEATRDLVLRARAARLARDSSLQSYDASVRERITARLAMSAHGPERVMYRRESAFRVQWQDQVGARIEVTGARIGIPVAPKEAGREAVAKGDGVTDIGISPVPQFSGQESMWLGGAVAQGDVDDRGVVNPLANGSEAYYTYALGDSMSWTLPDKRVVRLRELAVRPRSPKWNLAIGSLWVDAATGQLVRAAYRLAVPMDFWTSLDEHSRDEGTKINPILLKVGKGIVSPFRAQITGVAIEYGLFDGRYWLPRSRSMEGSQQISFVRMPIAIEQAFSYNGINGPGTLAAITVNDPDSTLVEPPDSLSAADAGKWRDSANADRARVRKTFNDSLRAAPCDASGQRVIARRSNNLLVAVSYPCDVDRLVHSADFTTPLYDANDELFGTQQRDALLAGALPFGAQALLRLGALPSPTFQYGLSMTRYNRIEGFSTGLAMEQQFGAGYVGTATGRLGTADRQPAVELSLARTNLRTTIALTAYNRLVSANDWGTPLSFGASVSGFLFGRDEGFYYRASGAELHWTTERGTSLDWRLFGEEERTATQRTDFSVGGEFVPNIVAARGAYTGAAVRWQHEQGLDPRGLRTFTDLRLEAATGDSTYGRAAMDVTLSSGLPGSFAGALTLAAGTSAGHLPPQRRWFLGGTRTIRGESPDTAQSGNAFWMSRLELGPDLSAYRVTVFGDLGWVGDRSAFRDIKRPMSAVGIGLSMVDGLVRFDVARGFFPQQQTRVSAYLQARF